MLFYWNDHRWANQDTVFPFFGGYQAASSIPNRFRNLAGTIIAPRFPTFADSMIRFPWSYQNAGIPAFVDSRYLSIPGIYGHLAHARNSFRALSFAKTGSRDS